MPALLLLPVPRPARHPALERRGGARSSPCGYRVQTFKGYWVHNHPIAATHADAAADDDDDGGDDDDDNDDDAK